MMPPPGSDSALASAVRSLTKPRMPVGESHFIDLAKDLDDEADKVDADEAD